MKITVNTRCVARDNSENAQRREAMRMASLAYGFHREGHDVSLCVPEGGPWSRDERWNTRPFSDIIKPAHRYNDILVVADYDNLEQCKAQTKMLVAFKTTPNPRPQWELARLESADLLISFHGSREVSVRDDVIVVPHGVSEKVHKALWSDGMLERYLEDDLRSLRNKYGGGARRGYGFIGNSIYGRNANMKVLQEQLKMPGDILWTGAANRPQIAATEYLRRVSSWKIGLCFGGDLPTSFRFSEVVMMGTVAAIQRWHNEYAEPLTDSNAIVVDTWQNVQAITTSLERLEDIQQGADESYCAGWSPRGQAKQVLKLYRDESR